LESRKSSGPVEKREGKREEAIGHTSDDTKTTNGKRGKEGVGASKIFKEYTERFLTSVGEGERCRRSKKIEKAEGLAQLTKRMSPIISERG